MDLIFLGTGNAFSESGDRPSSYALIQDEEVLLLDCGPSILPSLYQNNIQPNSITSIYISHIHPDHYMGLTFLFLDNYYISRRGKPIKVVGPAGLKEKLIQLVGIMYDDEEISSFHDCYDFVELKKSDCLKFDNWMFETLPAKHFAGGRMVVVTGDKDISIGYSGDTEFFPESLNRLIQKSNIIIHEATSAKYYIKGHTNLFELVDIEIPNDKHLFISHHDHTVVEALEHVQLPSNFHLARDNLRVNIPQLLSESTIGLDQ